MASTRFLAIYSALLWTPVICFGPAGGLIRPALVRGGPVVAVKVKVKVPPLLHRADHYVDRENTFAGEKVIPSDNGDGRRGQWKVGDYRRHFTICAALLCLCAVGIPSPCLASTSSVAYIPTISALKSSLVSILDGLSHSGTAGMAIYTISFIIWTMTVGVTTPIETAAGMAFPIHKSIPLSAIGKIGGAFFQYALAKYFFSEYARKKLQDNEWIDKINDSFQTNPYKVALIWRFSPLPEFVKNIGPALVPTLKTRYQVLATLTHGLPFTVLWSCIGNEAAMVARGVSLIQLLHAVILLLSW